MVVLVITACPEGLRGDCSKWLLEVSPGVFVGKPSARIRDLVWDRTVELLSGGRALMVYSSNTEQGLEFRSQGHDWKPTDFEGIQLMMRPTKAQLTTGRKTGWSKARRLRDPR